MGVFYLKSIVRAMLVILFTETTRQDSHVPRTANGGSTPTPPSPPHESNRPWLGMISKPLSLADNNHNTQLLLEPCVYINCYMYPCSACRGGVCTCDSAATAANNHNHNCY